MQASLHLAFLALIASLTACAAAGESAQVHSAAPIPANTPVENEGMRERNQELVARAQANPKARLMFLGDSITQGWDAAGKSVWDVEFAALEAINLGVGGDRTEHVLWRLQQGAYDQLRPEVIVMMIGTNNTGHRMDPPQDIEGGVRAILADLRRRYPKAKLALLAIFPRGETLDDEMRKNNAAANKLLAPLAREFGAEWLDLNRAFVDSQGVLSKELMPDLLHPNERGYDAWANAMSGSLKRWMR
jgi:beta-glucosidase